MRKPCTFSSLIMSRGFESSSCGQRPEFPNSLRARAGCRSHISPSRCLAIMYNEYKKEATCYCRYEISGGKAILIIFQIFSIYVWSILLDVGTLRRLLVVESSLKRRVLAWRSCLKDRRLPGCPGYRICCSEAEKFGIRELSENCGSLARFRE